MKIFVFLLLVTICQADRYDKDEDAFRFLSNMDMNLLVQTVQDEANELIQNDLTENDVQWLRVMTDDFAESLQQEMEKAVTTVSQSGHQNHQFTSDIMENLRRAADTISKGLDLTQQMLDKFVENITKGMDQLEESGLLEIDLDPMFQGLADRAMEAFEENTRKKRDIRNVFGHVNDTLHRVLGNMNGRFQDLHDFFEDHMKMSRDKMKPRIENMKILARDFIAHIKSAQRNVLQHAIEFFSPFGHKMGDVYVELMTKINNRLQRITETPIPAIYK